MPSQPKKPSPARATSDDLRTSIQRFVRSFGLLTADQTPCGVALSPSHAHALMVLKEREQQGAASTQQDLVRLLGIDKSNVARLCAKMAERGDVLQVDSATDGRAWSLALTTKGRQLALRVEAASRLRFERMLSAMPSDAARGDVLRALAVLNDAVAATRRMEETP
jgi:DNA-binding MarR family transcriptional regulator